MGGNQGGFNAAGEVSASASGIWPTVRVFLESSSRSTFTTEISQVVDCTGNTRSAPASPRSRTVTVVGGSSTTVTFTLPGPRPPAGSERVICLTVTVGGSSRNATASGHVVVESASEGQSGSPGSASPGGGSSYPPATPGAPGGGTASASTP
ncbi:hypothetical protein [Kitasatospora sp. NPDC092286]|uniref:hypothetical protein n=1 Tax=Kitasatospora sp. NPDC092286 TaxID=3364087 RepID=UPI00382666C2